jgi:HEAT repeat protein
LKGLLRLRRPDSKAIRATLSRLCSSHGLHRHALAFSAASAIITGKSTRIIGKGGKSMLARIKLSLTLILVLGIGQYARAGTELTKADIPPGLSPELKSLIEDTFSEESMTRRQAAVRFAKMGEKAAPAMPFILRLLNDRDPTVVNVVAGQLGDALGKYPALQKAPGVVEAIAHLSENTDYQRRCDAARLLAQSRVPGAFELLVKMLKDPKSGVREDVISALGDLGDRRVLPILKEIIHNSDKRVDEYLREGCAAEAALGKVGDKRDIYVLLDVLLNWLPKKYFTPTDMREGAVRGLGLLREREAIEPLEQILKDKLGHPYRVRAGAATALADIQGRDVAPLLKQIAIDRGEHEKVRMSAAIALVEVTKGEIDDVEVVNAVRFPSEENWDSILMPIARHGKTKAVRAEAQRYLPKDDLELLRKEGLLLTP